VQGDSKNHAERRSTENRSGQKPCNCHCFATYETGGLGFKDVHVTQFIEHVKIPLDHGPTTTVAGRLLKNVAEATIIERGCRGNIFSADAKSIHGLTTTGYDQTIQDLHLYNIHLQNDIKELEEWRENDIFLMDNICLKHSDKFDVFDLRRINYVCIHLNVNTLSGVTTATGVKSGYLPSTQYR